MSGSDESLRDSLRRMTDAEFITTWRAVFGGPPAAILDRQAMVAMLIDEGPATLVIRRPKPAVGARRRGRP